MKTKKFFIALAVAVLATIQFSYAQNIYEYCFGENEKIGIHVKTTTPKEFLENPDGFHVNAVINGPYYDSNGRTEGSIIIRDEGHTSVLVCCSGEIRGYLFYAKGVVLTGTALPNYLDDGRDILIIGTHPLLVVNGQVSSQAKEDRYNLGKNGNSRIAYRSAIGTKDNKHLCMVVSETQFTMKEWAQMLESEGYTQAINLDGGPVSQLAVKGEKSHGGGSHHTQLVICAER